MNIRRRQPGPSGRSLRYPAFRRLLGGLAVSAARRLALQPGPHRPGLRAHPFRSLGRGHHRRAVVPIVALGPLRGIVTDRFDRRRVMIISDVRGSFSCCCWPSSWSRPLPIALAPVLAAVATAFATPYLPFVSRPSLLAWSPYLRSAWRNAARSAVSALGIFAGPVSRRALAALSALPSLAFLLNALTFGLSALAVLVIPVWPDLPPRAVRSAPVGCAARVAYARRSALPPDALRLLGADIMCSSIYGTQTVLLLLVSRSLGMARTATATCSQASAPGP